MSVRLKEDESVLTQCQLQEFTATLTNARLVIVSPVSEESFPLRGVSGIGIYDDVEKYKVQVQEAKVKSTGRGAGIAFLIGMPLFILLSNKNEFGIGFFLFILLAIIGAVIGNQITPNIGIESILNIMQQGGSRQFRFHKTDNNAVSIKMFVEQVTETLS